MTCTHADDLAVSFLDLLELAEEVPEARLGDDVVEREDAHAVETTRGRGGWGEGGGRSEGARETGKWALCVNNNNFSVESNARALLSFFGSDRRKSRYVLSIPCAQNQNS